MSDPIVLLRQHFLNNQTVQSNGDNLVFENGETFPKSTETKFLQNNATSPYTLESIWFLLKNKDISHGDYVKACVSDNIPQIKRVDRNAIINAMSNSDSSLSFATPISSMPLDARKEDKMDIQSETAVSDHSANIPISQVISQERFFHDRLSILTNTKKSFKILLTSLKNSESNPKSSRAVHSHAPGAQRIIEKEHQQFSRDLLQPEEFWKVRMDGLSDVNITDTGGSLATILSGGVQQNNHNRHSSRPEDSRRESVKRSRSDSSSSSSKRGKHEKRKVKGNPIIIIPGVSSATINRLNAYQFFQNGEYILNPSTPADRSNRKIIIERTKKDGEVEKYEIVDSVVMIEDRDWDRVIATFVIGKDWELKNYKIKNVAELFHIIRGYYLNFDDSKLPDIIKKWNVKVLNISSHKRHLDQSVLSEFWSDLDSFRSQRA